MRALPRQSWRLRIYCAEGDRHGREPLYEAIVRAAHEAGLAGATVSKGSMGYGADSHIHTSRVLRLAEDQPVLVELVDDREHVDAFVPRLRELDFRGLVTLEPVEVLLQSASATD